MIYIGLGTLYFKLLCLQLSNRSYGHNKNSAGFYIFILLFFTGDDARPADFAPTQIIQKFWINAATNILAWPMFVLHDVVIDR